MSESKVRSQKENVVHSLPDWFIEATLPYSDTLTPVSVFNVAVMAFLQGDSEDWFASVESAAEQAFGTEQDGEALVTLVIELLEEVFPRLDTYLKILIPIEERVIIDVSAFDDLSFALTWDEGLIQ